MADLSVSVCTTPDQLSRDSSGTVRGAAAAGTTWDNGTTLTVFFMNGPSEYQDEVRTHVKKWEEFANIGFNFTTDPTAIIRISFTFPFTNPRNYNSVVGNQALHVHSSQPTMNLGFVPETLEEEFQGLILHEFGHALGLIHEHQRPDASFEFLKPQVYDYFRRIAGWDQATVDSQVIQRYTKSQISNHTTFDPDSIMLYPYPAEIARPPTKNNQRLSDLDKQLIGQMYPKPGTATTGSPADQGPSARPTDGGPTFGIPLLMGVAFKTFHAVPGTQDVYNFEVKEKKKYVMETTGEQAWVLTLFSKKDPGTAIQIDSLTGDGMNARIVQELDPGIFYLAVRHLIPEGTGEYGIVVRPSP